MAKNNKNEPQMNYLLNLEEIMKFVFENENNRNTDSEINEFYENKINLTIINDCLYSIFSINCSSSNS